MRRVHMRSLGQRILKLKGTVATRAAEIAELSDQIKSNENEQESLTAVRKKQNGAWAEETAEVKQALAALQAAITVLSKATTPSLIQGSMHLQAKYAVNNVLEKLPSRIGLPHDRMALLTEFISSEAGFAPQSATIQGMLGDMYLTFAANVESDTLEEANRNADYEKLYAALEKENNKLKDTRDRKETEKAEAEAMLADTTQNYEETEKQMNADIEFFGITKDACVDKHEEWTLRTKMRNAEIDGIDKALEILTSDSARALFAKSIAPGVGFLQIASAPGALLQESSQAPAAKAYTAIKALAKKSHSVRFAALAVHIRTSKAGHFDKVIDDINLMLKTLAEEGADDLDKRDQCLDEYQNINKKVNKLDWNIKNNEAKIAKLEKLIELRTGEKQDTIQKIKETNQYIADITAERKAENEAYLQAKKDDEGAVGLLEKARAAMAKFYKEQGIASLVQEPEFSRSEDAAPDATLSGKDNNQNASKTILALFDYILEDLADELSNAKKSEATSQSDFAEEKATAEKLVEDLVVKKVTLTGIIAKRNEDKEEENKDMKENNGDRTAEKKYQAKITPDCDWIIKAFDGRAEARAAEAAGLTTAKEFLAGRTALLQSQGKFDDAKFPSIGFLGISN